MKVPNKKTIFTEQENSNFFPKLLLLSLLIALGAYILLNSEVISGGEIEPLFQPTPESTRTSNSYIFESQAHFMAGNLGDAIKALEMALVEDPDNLPVLIELAKIQTYYSAILTSAESAEKLSEALGHIEHALSIEEINSDALAVYAFVLDWSADSVETAEEREALLVKAQINAQLAVRFDVNNVLANVYRAEVLVDQGDITLAFQIIETAVEADPTLMDAHRVYALLFEYAGLYHRAVEEYKLASEILPNYTYLYIKIGQNYRQYPIPLYNKALEYFDRAATINEVLGLEDPLPYVAIAKTYVRQGEFFSAARNMKKALDKDPYNPQLYGELGVIYFQSRNYEGSIPVFKCAVEGCLAEENEEHEIPVIGLELKNATVIYFYTYGSVLAALDYCDKAVEILAQVGDVYSEDQLIMDIVQDGLFICNN